ncbi:MAG: SDR family NAD(P)-dependent oxidoreductase [Acidimicrobiia bacterium]|nr:SDR family NAD(P)-dependent oxidoreductase [Acidimicrobiia bacterium]
MSESFGTERAVTRRAVVTGGAGFIGSHLCEALADAGWKVVSLDDCSTGSPANLERARSQGVQTLEVDITAPELAAAMSEARPQVVFHLAAVSSVTACARDPERCLAVNLEGTARVWEAASRCGADAMVNVSSLAVHGASDDAYGRSKRAAETFLTRRAPSERMRLVTLRPANVYGPRQHGDGESAVVATWLGAMARGEPLFLDGDGRQTRDFLYVDDAVAAMVLAADQAHGHTLELGRGVETSLGSLLQTMSQKTGWRGRPSRRPARPGDIRRSVVDPRPAIDLLGWEPQTGLDEGLRLTWEWLTGGV